MFLKSTFLALLLGTWCSNCSGSSSGSSTGSSGSGSYSGSSGGSGSSSTSGSSSSSSGSSGSSSSSSSESNVCPGLLDGTPAENEDPNVPDEATYSAALLTLDLGDVFDDLFDLLTDSQDCWPADEFNGEKSYAGLFLRLAWHAAGTYRATDDEGGAAGGRQRYQPESSWDDNANLDKARALLAPIKSKYGDALSWGDLMVFAGYAAILRGGGPVNRVCAGRIDQVDGSDSDVLNTLESCNINGNCSEPLGSSTVGLIYVNPEGFLGVPDPERTAIQVREIFGRMDMNDLEAVALIGGGHAFGKNHGACPLGAGPNPAEDPFNPWPGLCGDNFPEDTFTSGIEGAWTTYPFQWDNEFFTQLYFDEYTLGIGPGGKYQWTNTRNNLTMLTTDIAFINDDDYLDIVAEYATNQASLDFYFSQAWQKLTEADLTFPGRWSSNYFCVKGKKLKFKKGGNSNSNSNSNSGSGSGSYSGSGSGSNRGSGSASGSYSGSGSGSGSSSSGY